MHLRPREAATQNAAANLPFILWTQILALGLAAGGMLGRRLVGW
jgi:hypothetical protein